MTGFIKRALDINCYEENGQVFLEQGFDEAFSKIELAPEQIPMICDWLKEAAEAASKASARID